MKKFKKKTKKQIQSDQGERPRTEAILTAVHAWHRMKASSGWMRKMATRARLTYLTTKTKQEMLGLRGEDAGRWTVTTLSKRFGGDPRNVAAMLRLAEERERRDGGRDAEWKKRVEELRGRMIGAWAAVMEPRAGVGVGIARATEVVKGVEGRERADKEGEDDDEREGEEGEEEEEKEEVVLSDWAKYLQDGGCERAQVDVRRRTTFAFVEVGVAEGVRGGAWVREAHTGKLRVADASERKILLQEAGVRDCAEAAFLSENKQKE